MRPRPLANAAALAASLLFMLSCAGAAAARAQGPERVFAGWVGEYPVRMTLRRGAGGELSGSYSYEGRAGSLALKGSVAGGGDFTLEEFDGAKRTGVFKGRWRERDYEPEARLEGDWARPAGGGRQSFTLNEEPAAGPRLTEQRVKETDKARRFEIDARYPELQGAVPFNRLAHDFVRKQVVEFKRNPGERPADGAPFNSLRVGYTVRLAADDLQSVIFTVARIEYGMAHHAYEFHVINYDAKAGRVLSLADLFRPGSDYLKAVSDASVARLRRLNREDGDAYLGDPDYVENASAKPENYDLWTLTPRGIAVTFEPYQVGPFAAGSPNVLVPYAELKGLLRADGPFAPLAK